MRRIYLKAWWAVPCSGRKCLRTESQKDIAEILQSKLATIIEEDMEGMLLTPYQERMTNIQDQDDESTGNSNKKRSNRRRMGRSFKAEQNVRALYELLVTGFSTKLSSSSSSSSSGFAVIRN